MFAQAQRSAASLPGDVVLSVRNVSKKFCRNLRRSMWYGIRDLARNLLGLRSTHSEPKSSDEVQLRRDEFWALRDVSLELRRGEVLGLIGLNGSGKTTLLRLLTGIFPPDAGEIATRGRVGALIALGAGFHPHMTGRENIYLNGSILGLSQGKIRSKIDDIVDFAEIGDFIDAPVATYSSGMKVRLGFAVSTALSPDILLIDEVLAVGDLRFTLKCLNRVSEIIRDTAVVFVSHNMQMVSLISTRVMILDRGRIVCHEREPALGIDYYYEHYSGKRQATAMGSGRAQLQSCRILRDGKALPPHEVLSIPYGGTMDVELRYNLVAPVRELHVKLLLLGRAPGEVVDCPSGLAGCHLSGRPGEHIVRVKLQGLFLNSGAYSLTACFVDQATKESLLRVDGAAGFRVEHVYTSWAPWLMKAQWSEEPQGLGPTA